MKPYYEDENVTIYHADCREILKSLPGLKQAIITDPVWPNSSPSLVGAERPYELFREAAAHFAADRIAIQLGTDSDPRILSGLSASLPFFRTIDLEYANPSYKGRVLMGHDIAYLFGRPPAVRKDISAMIPGRFRDSDNNGKQSKHPTPRKLGHLKFLVSRWSEPDDIIVDPFMGSGTTLVASSFLRRRAIGIEIVEEYCEMAVERLRQKVLC